MTPSGAGAAAVDPLRRKALLLLFWFLTLSLLFNSLFGDMGLIQGYRQRRALARLGRDVRTLRAENGRLEDEIRDLRRNSYRVETIAREKLGLIRPGEIIFLFQDSPPGDAQRPAPVPDSGSLP